MLFNAGIEFNPEPEFEGASAIAKLEHSSALFSMTSKDAMKPQIGPSRGSRRALGTEQVRT
jgi:hypothetical protein